MSGGNTANVKADLKGIFQAAVNGTVYEPGKSARPTPKATTAPTANDYIIQRLIDEQKKPREKKPWWRKFTGGSSSYEPDAGYARPVSYNND